VDTKVRARHIFVKIPDRPTEKQVEERRRFAQSLIAQLKKGKTFEELARKHSDDSVTRDEGGDLGFFGRGTLPANVENVVFGMKKGEVSKPLRTSRGFHLIELIDRREASVRPYKEVRGALKQQLEQEKQQRATEAWVRELRKKAHVELKL
jgi:parvulin-like peptidyl-prolyl isomerase